MIQTQRGFTLLELMLVLVLIALSSSIVMFSYGQANGARETANHTADQVNSMVEFCVDKAAFEGKPLGMLLSATGWQIMQPVADNEDNWQWLPLLSEHRLPLAGQWDPDIAISTQPFELKDVEMPQIIILPDGQITPFSLSLNSQETRQTLVTLTSPGSFPLRRHITNEDRQ